MQLTLKKKHEKWSNISGWTSLTRGVKEAKFCCHIAHLSSPPHKHLYVWRFPHRDKHFAQLDLKQWRCSSTTEQKHNLCLFNIMLIATCKKLKCCDVSNELAETDTRIRIWCQFHSTFFLLVRYYAQHKGSRVMWRCWLILNESLNGPNAELTLQVAAHWHLRDVKISY